MIWASLVTAVLAPPSAVILPDAAWCWFADPRALWVNGKLLAGGVTADGDIVTSFLDPRSGKASISTLAKAFEKDDHDNPSFVALPNGELLAFYSKHTGPDMWIARSRDGVNWSQPQSFRLNDPAVPGPSGALNAYCYPNPQYLGREGELYLFWRGMNWKPTFSVSQDMGKTWSPGRVLISEPEGRASNRPYLKVWGDGERRIHLAFTDGHPRNEPTNSIYYLRLENGACFDAAGKRIGSLSRLPIHPENADLIYDGKSERVRSWIWDIGADYRGNPVVLYSRLPSEDKHVYRYASWNGKRWVDREITSAGKWFPQTPEGKQEQEPHYSGGLALDRTDSRVVYLSRETKSGFEVERWFTADSGNHWSKVSLGQGVRPVSPQGKRQPIGPEVLWLSLRKYVHYTNFESSVLGAGADRGPFSPEDPQRNMRAVQKWVMDNPSSYTKTEWMLAPLYTGMIESGLLVRDLRPVQWVEEIAGELGWKLGPRPFMADDQAVGQAYLQLHRIKPDPVRLAATKVWADSMLARPHDESLKWENGIHNREWAWCDALYMAPPTLCMLARTTGDDRYATLAIRLWQKTADYLYDPEERLFYRDSRYFEPKEANGRKVFWSRGNGWVMAGAARMLQELGPNHAQAASLKKIFTAMAHRLAELQTADGTWHASLLDPSSYPAKETSGTGFNCYALAWGVRIGILPQEKFEPVIRKSYAALTQCLDLNGKLGWVQPIGQDPKLVNVFDTDVYGVGAYLQASAQVAQFEDSE